MKILLKQFVTVLVSAGFAFAAWGQSTQPASTADDLPDIGSPAGAMVTLADEYQVGRMIVRGLRDSDQILEDPEVTEYINSLGSRLSSEAHEGAQKFSFFVDREPISTRSPCPAASSA